MLSMRAFRWKAFGHASLLQNNSAFSVEADRINKSQFRHRSKRYCPQHIDLRGSS